jgi:3-oxoacyl-[acyl-carrier-protein] synthase-1
MRMALVDDQDLEPLLPAHAAAGFSDRERRMIRLAAPAIREATEGLVLTAPPPLFLGMPCRMERPKPTLAMATAIAKQSGVQLDEKASQVFLAGRAAFFLALEQGLRLLDSGRAASVIVGAVDTHLDLRVLAELDAEERLLGDRVVDGFIPGEGAGFLVLGRATSTANRATSFIAGVGLAMDPGHRYAQAPDRGEGLWNAMNALFGHSPLGGAKISSTFAGLNGENFGVKEWGIARLRHKACFADPDHLEHPADCYGDLGAATGGVLMALAHIALTHRHCSGPALVWASSDREERGCALVDTNQER